VLADEGLIDLGDQQLEYSFIGPKPEAAPTIIMLHEGLGSARQWGPFPDKLFEATGCGVFVYSRAGYGASSSISLPRPLTYMHHEALDVLPRLLEAIGLRRGALVGHSDGGSIAAIFAGGIADRRIEAVSLFAPHFFTEDLGIQEIARIKDVYEAGDLKPRLARWHADVDAAFYGWNGAWLDPKFRQWDICEYLPKIRCALQILQGENDPYGSMRQVERLIDEQPSTEVVCLPQIGHSPHREAPEITLAKVAGYMRRILKP
jgi:pimeloyl-ACP methyl ester carboxylesterase